MSSLTKTIAVAGVVATLAAPASAQSGPRGNYDGGWHRGYGYGGGGAAVRLGLAAGAAASTFPYDGYGNYRTPYGSGYYGPGDDAYGPDYGYYGY